jgi:hypothetical protein
VLLLSRVPAFQGIGGFVNTPLSRSMNGARKSHRSHKQEGVQRAKKKKRRRKRGERRVIYMGCL